MLIKGSTRYCNFHDLMVCFWNLCKLDIPLCLFTLMSIITVNDKDFRISDIKINNLHFMLHIANLLKQTHNIQDLYCILILFIFSPSQNVWHNLSCHALQGLYCHLLDYINIYFKLRIHLFYPYPFSNSQWFVGH